MALDQRDVEIQSPCPVDLDAARMRGMGSSWHCGHCDKAVHVLSSMTETEARTFLRAHAGKDICVSYAMSPTGEVRFRPEPIVRIVPVASLVRRPARIAAVGLSLALAACAPHDHPEVASQPVMHMETVPQVIAKPTTVPSVPAPDIMVDGGMRVREDVQVEGLIRPIEKVVDEPCDPPMPTTKRGMMKRID